jgi:DNA-entry nuclease
MQKELERLKMDIKASKKAVYAWVAAILILIALLLVISGCGANNSTDDTTEAISLNQVGEYSGAPYVYLNNNMPYFTDEEKENTKPFENYSSLDDLGRCGVAFANIYKELMPTEERGPIGQIKPSGWHTVKYNGIIIYELRKYLTI